jgi:hypothetical protein
MSHIKGEFDVQVDGNHRWDTDKVCEIDVYPVYIDADGDRATDTQTTLASVRIPTGDYSDDMWYDLPSAWEKLSELPAHIRAGVDKAIEYALAVHTGIKRTQKYDKGDRVFITEYRFPGEIVAHTIDGGYIVEMASSGVLDYFKESELEDYDQELWHRP